MSEKNQKSTTWRKFTLKEVMDEKTGFKRGPFGGALKKEIFVDCGYAVYEQQHVINNNFKNIRYFIDAEKYRELISFKIKKDDILVSCSGTVGRIALVPDNVQEGVINQALLRLRPNSNIISSNYAWFLLNSSFMQSKMVEMSHGSTLKNIVAVKELKNIEVFIPSLSEQQKITSILSAIDEAIEITGVILEKTREVKKGLMQQLFTKGIGHTKFKKTEVGEIPEGWELKSLENVSEKIFVGIASSTTNSYSDDLNDVIIIRNQNIRENKLDLIDVLRITREFSEANKNKKVKQGDLVTVRTGYPGITSVIPKELEGMQTFTTLITRLNQQIINPHFMAYYINSPIGKRLVTGGKVGGAQQNLNVAVMKKFKVVVPSIVEQNNIVSILSVIDSKIEKEQKKLSSLQTIKTGLMQSLLTGKVCVKVDEAEVTQV
ncbi:restriction endonuclease subunit S [Bacillus cereus]|uniref:restriction endonuclease subunit S n=1 Tax=Bacillus cereus TaxID=1396 RepID=UPI00203B09D7|nr:restriction endonuclease subunit S [Bacillus cereus]